MRFLVALIDKSGDSHTADLKKKLKYPRPARRKKRK